MINLQKLMVVDDDPHIREVLRFALEKAGFHVVEAKDGQHAIVQFTQHQPDLVVLDIMMPEFDGMEVCRQLRQQSNVPIIFLTAKDDEIDRIVGLEIGGDDYLTKPFSPREVVARVKAIFRRIALCQQTDRSETDQQHGFLRLDIEGIKTFWQDHEVVLTATEFALIEAMIQRPGRVYSRQTLVDRAYSINVVVSDRTIDSHIRRIRQKFKRVGGDPIVTVHGIGYKLGLCDT